jgi:hypothetical protein
MTGSLRSLAKKHDYVTGALMRSGLILIKAEPGGRKGEPFCTSLYYAEPIRVL